MQTLQASSVTARDAVVTLRDAEMPPSTRPPRFLPQFLRVDVRNVELTRVRYVHTNGTVVEANRALGSRVTMTARTLRVGDVQCRGRATSERKAELTLRAGKPFGMKANGSGHLRMSNGVVVALDGKADGDFERLEIAGQLLQPQQASATALLTRPDERWNIAGHVDARRRSRWIHACRSRRSRCATSLSTCSAEPDRIGIAGNVGIPELDSSDLTVDAQRQLREARAAHRRRRTSR